MLWFGVSTRRIRRRTYTSSNRQILRMTYIDVIGDLYGVAATFAPPCTDQAVEGIQPNYPYKDTILR